MEQKAKRMEKFLEEKTQRKHKEDKDRKRREEMFIVLLRDFVGDLNLSSSDLI